MHPNAHPAPSGSISMSGQQFHKPSATSTFAVEIRRLQAVARLAAGLLRTPNANKVPKSDLAPAPCRSWG